MEYNKVKKEYDGKYLLNSDRRIMVVVTANELYTFCELKKLIGIERIHEYSYMFNTVEISRKNTFVDRFGCRFEKKEI